MNHKLRLILIFIIAIIALFLVKQISRSIAVNRISYIEISKFEYIDYKAKISRTWKFEDRVSIREIIDALNDRKKIHGKIDIEAREYMIQIAYKNGKTEEFSLWINDTVGGDGVLMKGGDAWSLKSNAFFKEILK